MKRAVLFLAIALSCSPHAWALTDKAKEALKQLEQEAAEAAKSPGNGNGDLEKQNMRMMMVRRVATLLNDSNRGENREEMLSQLSVYFTSESGRKNFEILQLEIAAEQAAKEKVALETANELLARAGKVVREAKTAADLDELIAELGKSKRNEYRIRSEELLAAENQLERTMRYVTIWQNYLSAKSLGNWDNAKEALRTLSNSEQPPIVPRSEILRLLSAPEPVKSKPADASVSSKAEEIDAILANIKSLDNIQTGLGELRGLRSESSNYGRNEEVNAVIFALTPIDKSYQEFKAGLATSLELNNMGNPLTVGNATVARLKAELMMLMIPRYVGAPAGTQAKPGEDVVQFLNRLGDEAKAKGDVPMVLRVRETLRLVQRGNTYSASDTSGMSSFVSGQNQETAGQPMLAVISYQSALKTGSDLVPAKLIGERLAAIKAEFPKEYEAGMERFLNPPPRYVEPPGYPRMPGMPSGMPTPPEKDRAPALLIPPAPVSSPTPEAKQKK